LFCCNSCLEWIKLYARHPNRSGDNGARGLIAAARENIPALTAEGAAKEIDIDTKEGPHLLHGIRST
jgi:hypothetical protein